MPPGLFVKYSSVGISADRGGCTLKKPAVKHEAHWNISSSTATTNK